MQHIPVVYRRAFGGKVRMACDLRIFARTESFNSRIFGMHYCGFHFGHLVVVQQFDLEYVGIFRVGESLTILTEGWVQGDPSAPGGATIVFVCAVMTIETAFAFGTSTWDTFIRRGSRVLVLRWVDDAMMTDFPVGSTPMLGVLHYEISDIKIVHCINYRFGDEDPSVFVGLRWSVVDGDCIHFRVSVSGVFQHAFGCKFRSQTLLG